MSHFKSKDDTAPRQVNFERALSTKENMLWNSVGNFIYLVSQWLLTYVVVRILGYKDAGIFSLAMTIGTSFSTIALYSMRNYQVSDIGEEYTTHTYLASRHVTCALAMIACAAFVLANGYDYYSLLCILVYMLFKTSEALSDVFQGVMQKKMRMDYIGISFAVKGVIEFLFFFAMLLIIGDLLIAIIVLTAISYTIIILYDRRMALKNVELGATTARQIGSLLFACLPIAIFGFLFNTAGLMPRYYIEALLGAEQLGYYTSVAMPVVVIQVFANYIFAPLVTPMAQHLYRGEMEGLVSLLKKTTLAIAAISLLAFAGFALLGEWMLVLLFGESIAPFSYLLIPLVLCAVLTAFAWFLSAVITVLRKHHTLLVASAISFAIVAFGGMPFIKMFGLNGASFILAIALLSFVVIGAYVIYAAMKNAR